MYVIERVSTVDSALRVICQEARQQPIDRFHRGKSKDRKLEGYR